MGVSIHQREGADRRRVIHIRKQGTAAYPAWILTLPTWLAREIAGSEDKDEVDEALSQFTFMPERTPEGILYRVTRMETQEGWQ